MLAARACLHPRCCLLACVRRRRMWFGLGGVQRRADSFAFLATCVPIPNVRPGSRGGGGGHWVAAVDGKVGVLAASQRPTGLAAPLAASLSRRPSLPPGLLSCPCVCTASRARRLPSRTGPPAATAGHLAILFTKGAQWTRRKPPLQRYKLPCPLRQPPSAEPPTLSGLGPTPCAGVPCSPPLRPHPPP